MYISGNTLTTVLGDLFDAGSSTTTATLEWAFLYILTHPEVQVKLQKELDSVTGTTRPPCLADRPRLVELSIPIDIDHLILIDKNITK